MAEVLVTNTKNRIRRTLRNRCRGHNKDGSQCRDPSLAGANVCRMHGGKAPQVQRKAKERVKREKAEMTLASAIDEFDLDPVHPAEALLESVAYSRAILTFLRQKVGSLDVDDIAGLFTTSEKYDEETGNTTITKYVGGNVWVKLLGEWEDRITKSSKMAIDAGIAERQTQVIESQAALFASTLWSILSELGIEQGPQTTAVVRRHMLSLKADNGDQH